MTDTHHERRRKLHIPLLSKHTSTTYNATIHDHITELIDAHQQGKLPQCQDQYIEALKNAGMKHAHIKKILKNIQAGQYNIFSPRATQATED